LCNCSLQSQEKIPINLYKSTQIIFNDKIENIIIGTGDLQIKKTRLGNVISLIAKAQHKDFVNTNLYVSTQKGFHYNFSLVYENQPKSWTIPINEELATIKPLKTVSKKELLNNTPTLNKNFDNEVLKALLADRRRAKRYYERFDDIYLRYVNHYYYNQHVYYKLEITNSSNQDYIIDFFKVFIDTKGKKGNKKKSNTRKLLLLDKDYTSIYGKDSINPKETITMIFMFSKLSLNKEQKLSLELKEKNGNRDLILQLRSRLVNDPYALKL
jgi:hypothetical protein